jgi:hypothetical protein
VREFTVLQRLFRTILRGGFGDGFPTERLIALTRDTGKDVELAHTPRSNYEQ